MAQSPIDKLLQAQLFLARLHWLITTPEGQKLMRDVGAVRRAEIKAYEESRMERDG